MPPPTHLFPTRLLISLLLSQRRPITVIKRYNTEIKSPITSPLCSCQRVTLNMWTQRFRPLFITLPFLRISLNDGHTVLLSFAHWLFSVLAKCLAHVRFQSLLSNITTQHIGHSRLLPLFAALRQACHAESANSAISYLLPPLLRIRLHGVYSSVNLCLSNLLILFMMQSNNLLLRIFVNIYEVLFFTHTVTNVNV